MISQILITQLSVPKKKKKKRVVSRHPVVGDIKYMVMKPLVMLFLPSSGSCWSRTPHIFSVVNCLHHCFFYLVGNILSPVVILGCGFLGMFPCESPWKWHPPSQEMAGPWPYLWAEWGGCEECSLGDIVWKVCLIPSTVEWPHDHVADPYSIGNLYHWDVFVGCGQCSKQICLLATPLLQPSRYSQGHAHS